MDELQTTEMSPVEIERMEAERMERELALAEALAAKVDAFGASLKSKRDDAVAARKNSGIEDEWEECEEMYQGIDDANRGSMRSGKPSGPNGGYVNGPSFNQGVRSTVFLNITRPYVDAAAARVGDMLLPTDDTPWSLKPTPVPDMHDEAMAMAEQAGMMQQPQQPAGMPGMPGMEGMGQEMPGMAPGQELMAPQADFQPQKSELAKRLEQIEDEAKSRAERATKQIEDWHVECQWHAEVRKMIEDCARLGTGILKGPFPIKRRSRVSVGGEGMMAFEVRDEIKPATKAISPWRFYPDPGCGENIQDGSYCWEEDSITLRGLRDLKGMPGYLDRQIDKVLEQGPQGIDNDPGYIYGKVQPKDTDNFRIWYFYGFAEREDLQAAGVDLPEEAADISVPCVVTMVNDVVIKASLSPLDSGLFPFDVMPWQRKTAVPWGTGVAKQINAPQRMLNAATRNMMDNSGLSAGPQIIIRKGVVMPADGKWALTPRKFWYANEGADVNSVQQAFMAVNIPTMQAELQNIIQFALKMAEDVTGLPMLMQGQSGETAPDTVGGMQILHNNASVVLRRIARLFDDRVTEPHIRRYYEWLQMYHDDPSMKGDFQIDARGSTALVERDIQNQYILQMGQLVMNPAFGIDPEKWIQEALKAQRLDPKRFLMDEDKKAAMAQQPQPKAPQVEAAEIRAQTELQKTQIVAEANVRRMEVDTDRDRVYVEAQMARDQTNAQAKMAELELKRELAMLDYANKRELTLEQVKAKLAETAMKLQTTKELAGQKAHADMMPTPPVEPPGRAPVGESFQK
jgi:hypothetical protein